jgi:hypothetical protein
MYPLTILSSLKRSASFADFGMPGYGVLRPALKKSRTNAYRSPDEIHRFAWVVRQDPFRFLDLPAGMFSDPHSKLMVTNVVAHRDSQQDL